MATKGILLPLFISILVAIGLTYLIIMYLPLVIESVLLFIVAVVIFSAILAVMWIVMQLVLLPYYALRNVKPKEEESKGGYGLKEVKPAKSETTETQPESVKPKKISCPVCSAEVQPDAEFCPYCGAKLR